MVKVKAGQATPADKRGAAGEADSSAKRLKSEAAAAPTDAAQREDGTGLAGLLGAYLCEAA